MGWFDEIKSPKIKQVKRSHNSGPTGLWKKCVNCKEILQVQKLEENSQVCPYCDHHYRLSSLERIELLCDQGTFQEIESYPVSTDPLQFVDKKPYDQRLKDLRSQEGAQESVRAGVGQIDGQKISMAVMEFGFMGGSMGVVCGEVIAQAMDVAREQSIPCVVISSSGGARMQEGILSLMQMGKTSVARALLKKKRIPYLSVLTDPTTGGCAASFSMQGDVNLAEPKALIGFAGPRVIQQSIGQSLPEGFQRSEFLEDHGFIDRIVHRHRLKEEISFFVRFFS